MIYFKAKMCKRFFDLVYDKEKRVSPKARLLGNPLPVYDPLAYVQTPFYKDCASKGLFQAYFCCKNL
jgi:hypothetical protein